MNEQKYICSYYVNDEKGFIRADVFSSDEDNFYIVKYFDESQTLIWGETRKGDLEMIAETLHESSFA